MSRLYLTFYLKKNALITASWYCWFRYRMYTKERNEKMSSVFQSARHASALLEITLLIRV